MVKLKIRKQKVSQKNVNRLEKLAGKAMIGRYENFVKHAEEVKSCFKTLERKEWCKAVLLGQAGYWAKLEVNLLKAGKEDDAKEYGERAVFLKAFGGLFELGYFDELALKQFDEYLVVLRKERDML